MKRVRVRRYRRGGKIVGAHMRGIVSAVDDSERFTNAYNIYDPESGVHGGDVMDYVVHKIR